MGDTEFLIPRMRNDELYHHGIKGMKWGVRRYQNYDGTLIKSNKKHKKLTPDQKAKSAMKKDVKNRRLLSDVELKRKIDRIKMQKQLKELTMEEINPGKKYVTDILGKVGKTSLTGGLIYLGKAALTGNFDIKEAAGYMFVKPKNK